MPTSLKIDDQLKSRVRALADAQQRTPHWIMREAIAQYVVREEARLSFRQEAQAAWAAYREDGQHLRGDEVESWLKTWGTANETAPPRCHD